MPRIVETVVYPIEELPETAKESARAWYREACLDHEWYDFVFEDFETICRILGISLRTSPVKLMGGGTRDQPHILFRGFGSQGDGACFEGSLSYARGGAKAIRPHAPKDTELIRIADVLQAVQRKNIYQLTANIVSGAGCPPEFQLDAGSKFQGRSSRMRDCGWPAAIFSSVFVSQA